MLHTIMQKTYGTLDHWLEVLGQIVVCILILMQLNLIQMIQQQPYQLFMVTKKGAHLYMHTKKESMMMDQL